MEESEKCLQGGYLPGNGCLRVAPALQLRDVLDDEGSVDGVPARRIAVDVGGGLEVGAELREVVSVGGNRVAGGAFLDGQIVEELTDAVVRDHDHHLAWLE